VADLLVVVPTRGRPHAVVPIVEAWNVTGAWDDAELLFVVDADDPTSDGYREALALAPLADQLVGTAVRLMVADRWQPLVPKLNEAVAGFVDDYWALGFAGDDHRPRTTGWARAMLAALVDMGTGVVYGNDLLHGERLASSWVMTSDIVRTLGRMVPAPVEHMACDNAVMALAADAGCLAYLPDVVIEHLHPLVGKAEWDPGYWRVNRPEQYERDMATFTAWVESGLVEDAARVRALRAVRT
jgi:hypothetical protein